MPLPSLTHCAFAGCRANSFLRAGLGSMVLSAVTTLFRFLALGSYVTIFVTSETLPESALPVVPLAFEDLALARYDPRR